MIIIIQEQSGVYEIVEPRLVLRVADFNIPNGVQESEFTTKGGILVGTGEGTFQEQQPGTDGQILVYDSTQQGGVRADWITVESIKGTLDQWEALGLPTDSASQYVYAIAYDEANNCIYVTGGFTEIGGVVTAKTAKYDLTTKQWSSMGTGITGIGRSIVLDGDKVYFGSETAGTDYGGLFVYTISTGTWVEIIGSKTIYSMCRVGADSLYIVGSFSYLGAVTATKIAKYTISTGVFEGMGDTGMYAINTIINVENYLYIGGHHGTLSYGILRYEISTGTWSSIDPDNYINTGQVRAIQNVGNYLYVAGDISNIGYIARYDFDTEAWGSIGGGLNLPVWALGVLGNKLIVGGQFTDDGGANRLIMYDMVTGEWEAVGSFDSTVVAICAWTDTVVVGGLYDTINGIPTRMIAMLHTDLTSVLSGYNAQIVQLQTDVVALETIGTAATAHIASTANPHSVTATQAGAPDVSASTGALADDTVYSFTPRATSGIIIVCNAGGYAAAENVIAFYNTVTPTITSFVIGANTVVGTGALTDGAGDGTDNKLNVNSHTDGKIYIKNRMGGNRTYRVQIFTL